MIKQISTYGAVILTTMVIIRAATMEKESKSDVRSLYERTTDQSYVTSNLDLRNSYTPTIFSSNTLLAATIKTAVENPFRHKRNSIMISTPNQMDLDGTDFIDLSAAVILEEKISGEDNFSLDRESTINSNLSTLFPRQRIEPKPSPF